YPLATIWDIVPLFGAIDAVAIAQPSAANRRAVARFAAGAERYLNRGLHPVAGFSPYPGDRTAGTKTWFDDNGWWGLGFVNAYLLNFSPQYDAIYLQWMLALYALDGDATLYRLAADNARNAEARALNGEGLYLLSWNGETLPRQYARPGLLQTHAATTSLMAWLAVYPPPA